MKIVFYEKDKLMKDLLYCFSPAYNLAPFIKVMKNFYFISDFQEFDFFRFAMNIEQTTMRAGAATVKSSRRNWTSPTCSLDWPKTLSNVFARFLHFYIVQMAPQQNSGQITEALHLRQKCGFLVTEKEIWCSTYFETENNLI